MDYKKFTKKDGFKFGHDSLLSVKIESDCIYDGGSNEIVFDILYLSSKKIQSLEDWPSHRTDDPLLYFATVQERVFSYNIEKKKIEREFNPGYRINCMELLSQRILTQGKDGSVAIYRCHDFKLICQSSIQLYTTIWRILVLKNGDFVSGNNAWAYPTNGYIKYYKYRKEKGKVKCEKIESDHTGSIWDLLELKTNPNILISCGGGAHVNCRDFSLRKWNLRTKRLIKRFPQKNLGGMIKLSSIIIRNELEEEEEYILAGSRDGSVVTFNVEGQVKYRVHHPKVEGVYSFVKVGLRYFMGGMKGSLSFFDFKIPKSFGSGIYEKKIIKMEEEEEELEGEEILPNVYYSKEISNISGKIFRLEWVSDDFSCFASCSNEGTVHIHKVVRDQWRVWKRDVLERINFLHSDDISFIVRRKISLFGFNIFTVKLFVIMNI